MVLTLESHKVVVLCLLGPQSSENWKALAGLEHALPRWLTHLAGRLVLALGWETQCLSIGLLEL